MNAVTLIGGLLSFVIAIAIFSLLNGVFLRFAAKIVLKQAPELPATFGYSFVAALAYSLVQVAVSSISASTPFSEKGVVGNAFELTLLGVVPLIVFLTLLWLIVSNFLKTGLEYEGIGYAKGLAVTAVDTTFLLCLGLVLAIGIAFLTA